MSGDFVANVPFGLMVPAARGRPAAPGAGGAVPAYVRRAESYMQANADRAILVRDVAEAAGCSMRALQYAFRRFRGIGPKAALAHIRLDRAREVLGRSDEGVAMTAQRFGFSNVGRFTTAYAERFGETPSVTRRTRRR